MRITSKGQVTIPKHIRDKLGVQPGDEIGFREEGPLVIIEGTTDTGATGVVEQLRAMGRKHLIRDTLGDQSVDEIVNQLRGYGEDANDPGFKHPA